MQRVQKLLRGVGLMLLVIPLAAGALTAYAEGSTAMLIVAVQTQGAADAGGASAEFVELRNQTGLAQAVEGWRLQYKSATGSTWTTWATLQGNLASGAGLLLATSAYVTAQPHQTMTSGLAKDGGHLQLIDTAGKVHDLVGWGTAVTAAGSPAAAPDAGQQLRRKSSGDLFQNTGNNAQDFNVSGQTAAPAVAGVQTTDTDEPALLLEITELLPNPGSPATDASDEFIELYNPNSTPVNLAGYKLQAGASNQYSHTFDDGTIPAGAYQTFYSRDTKLTLNNNSGKARLLSANGDLVSETSVYDTAVDNQSWSLVGSSWQWTALATPGAANQALAKTETKASKTTKSKASTAKGATGSKASAKKAGESTSSNKSPALAAAKPAPLHPLVLAGVGSLAVAYAAYEYRHDLANRLFQLRRYLASRRSARAKV